MNKKQYFKRPCKRCDETFTPTGKENWICEKCNSKIVSYGERKHIPGRIIGAEEYPCETCGGSGKVDCTECDGDGFIQCPHCGQDMVCDECDSLCEVECPDCC